MRDEYLSFSIAGVCALFLAGAFFGGFVSGHCDPGGIAAFIMLVVCARADVRESTRSGTYKRGWFVWRRIGPADPADDQGASA